MDHWDDGAHLTHGIKQKNILRAVVGSTLLCRFERIEHLSFSREKTLFGGQQYFKGVVGVFWVVVGISNVLLFILKIN